MAVRVTCLVQHIMGLNKMDSLTDIRANILVAIFITISSGPKEESNT